MTTAFVLSGGANLGAVQVGMMRALHEAGVRPDMLVGASVGAINAGWLAGADPHDGVDELADIWISLQRRDVFPVRFGWGLAGFLGRRASLVDASGLRHLILNHVRFERLEDAPIPLHVVVTDVLDGRDVALSTGSAVEVITASAAIPGVFPPVPLDDRVYMDGGVVNNAPVSHAVELGADTVYVLATGYACSLREPPASALGMTLHAVSLMINRRLSADVEHYLGRADVRVIPPPCPVDVRPGDFGQAEMLIERSYDATVAWLHDDGEQCVGNPLAEHAHRG
ncbi:MAG: patatin-like phospholipase family protein [Ilumatobacteraceae bacterium]